MENDEKVMSVKTQEFQVTLKAGLHLRPITLLAKTANRFESDIRISKGELSADVKLGIFDMMLLKAECGEIVQVEANGEDADKALEVIGHLFQENFGISEEAENIQ